MIINPTKKTIPLFSALPQTKNPPNSKAFAAMNPFFSWHANYFNIKRKKMLLLVNDYSYTPVLLADINAQRKKNLYEYIQKGIRSAFRLGGIEDKEIDRYFELAGPTEVNAAYNRAIISVMNNRIRDVQTFPNYSPEVIQRKAMEWLAEIPFKKLQWFVSTELVKEAFQTQMQINLSKTAASAGESFKPVVIWRPFATWDKYIDNEGWFEGYDEMAKEVRENNLLVIHAFGEYLEASKGLSAKVIQNHIDNVAFYVNEFLLYYGILTPISDLEDSPADFLSDWFPRKAMWASKSSIKSTGASLKKFYTFLAETGEIDKKQLRSVKESISDGVELGLEYLENEEELFW